MSQSGEFCTFLVGGMCCGVEVRLVQEVIRYQAMTSVPLAAREVAGLINLRGQIVTALDLRRRLELPDRPAGELPMNVVIRTDEGAVSLLVDEIGDVLQLDPTTFEPAPETLRGVCREMISGVHKLKDGLMLVLDTRAAVTLAGGRNNEMAEAA